MIQINLEALFLLEDSQKSAQILSNDSVPKSPVEKFLQSVLCSPVGVFSWLNPLHFLNFSLIKNRQFFMMYLKSLSYFILFPGTL